jgi:hypothetical protein
MAKQSIKTELEIVANNKPKNEIEAVVAIAETAISFRGEQPSLASILRYCSGAARLLRIENKDRDGIANSAALSLGRKHNLLGTAG